MLTEKGISTAVLNVSTPLQLDEDVLNKYLINNLAFTYEDHNINTGLFSILSQYVATHGKHIRLIPFGIKNYSLSGNPEEVFALIGLDEQSVAATIEKYIVSF